MPRLARKVLQSAFVLYWLPVFGWMAAIVILPRFLGSSLPSPRSLLDELFRGGIHIMEYGVLAFLLHRTLGPKPHYEPLSRHPDQTVIGWKPYLATFLIAALYAVLDEAQQSFIPNRQPALLDFLADSLRVLLALAGIAIITRPSMK